VISPSALGQAILSLLCFDEVNAPKIALRLDSKLFQGRGNQQIARVAIEYIQKYRRPPGAQLEFLLEAELRRGEEGRFLGQTLDLLKKDFANLQPEFILSELDEFEESQRINNAAQLAIEAVASGDLQAARKALYAPNGKQKGSPGIWLSDSKAMFKDYDKEETEFFSSGIQAADELGAKPERKTLTYFLAATGKGKTWFLINCAKAGLQYGRSVLYVTLELSEEKTAKRFLQNIFSLTAYEAKEVRVPYFEVDSAAGTRTLSFRDLQRDSVLNKRRELEQRLQSITSWPRLLIKEFPTGMLSLSQLQLYLDQLEKEEGFTPDILIIDQANNMQLRTDNLRIDIGRLWVDLRGIAVERNLALITASQGNRESATTKVVDITNTAEDWSIPGTADLAFSYSQTQAEFNLGLSRILISKARDVEYSRTMLLNTQCYSIGQFSLESAVFSRNIASQMEQLTPET
jgi:KaiC/GvpD/RAD55 family RecA-like ATPase